MLEGDARREEETLIARCRQGDTAAFDILIAAHGARIYNLAYRMLGSAPEAEDAAQEAFIRAFSSLKKFQGKSAFTTWLHRIALNVCLDELKRRKSRPQPFASLQKEEEAPTPEDYLSGNPNETDPQLIIEQRQQQAEVQAALKTLPDFQRAVVVLCDLEGASYEEAAAALNTNVGTIKSRLHRARQSLRQILAPARELSSQEAGQKL